MLTSLHGVLAGTDAQSPLFLATTIAAVVSVVFATIYRVVTRRDRSQRVRSIDPSATSRPGPSAPTQNRRVVYPVTQQR